MQGVLIASANTAVQKALAAILQDGRTIQTARSVSDSLSMATAQRFDYIFIDDMFEDGSAEELVRRLHSLGYSIELIPILLATDQFYLRPFLQYGVEHAIAKPFEVEQVEHVTAHVEKLIDLQDIPLQSTQSPPLPTDRPPSPESVSSPRDWAPRSDVDVREISQRLKRMITKLSDREDLIRAFADSLQEQFDVDNVVVLLPYSGSPAFRIREGNVPPEVREQFHIPLDEPLIAALTRLGEPVWVHDRERLGRQNAITATRYGERLHIQVLCPVLSRGRLIALVGLSRFHRYDNSPVLISLLRLFLTFFSEALENTQMYERLSEAGETYRNMVDAAPHGAFAVSDNGRTLHLNPKAAEMLGREAAELITQPIERVGSIVADTAWRAMRSGQQVPARIVKIDGRELQLSATPLNMGDQHVGALVWLQLPDSMPESDTQEATGHETTDWSSVARVIAHNFKNALVPVKTCAELLPERYQSEAFRQSFFNVVQDNIGQLDRWIKELLRYAQTVEDPEAWEVIPLHDCLHEAVQQALEIRPEIKSALQANIEEEHFVRGNRESLAKAFLELLKNAWDAVQDVAQPVITLSTRKSNDEILVSLADNGPGLEELDKESALRPFSTSKLSGLGLGLAYAQRVATLHQGNIELASGADGTNVTLHLPAAQQAPVSV